MTFFKKISGKYPVKPEFPAIGGNECVAKVLEVGSDVKNLSVGDLVIPFATGLGTWRSHAIYSEGELMKVPDGVPLTEAATITVNPCTAYRMLKDFVKLASGDTVIQNGANSACGQNAIQLCKTWGIHNIGIVRDRPDIENLKKYLKDLGASEVLTEEECRTTKIFKSGQYSKPKLALNCVGGKNALEMSKHLDQDGVMVTYGGMSREPVIVSTAALIFKDHQFRGFWMTRWKEQHGRDSESIAMFEDLFQIVKNNELKAPKHELIPYQKYEEAFKNALQGFAGAKILLDFTT
jgi:mitochondrial enoyl-[acyl-carrier protein] reductase / trans-2-enoyl-CoA reductase